MTAWERWKRLTSYSGNVSFLPWPTVQCNTSYFLHEILNMCHKMLYRESAKVEEDYREMQFQEKVISNCDKTLHNFLILPSLSTPLVKSAGFSSCFLPFYACFRILMSQANVRCYVFITVIYLFYRTYSSGCCLVLLTEERKSHPLHLATSQFLCDDPDKFSV